MDGVVLPVETLSVSALPAEMTAGSAKRYAPVGDGVTVGVGVIVAVGVAVGVLVGIGETVPVETGVGVGDGVVTWHMAEAASTAPVALAIELVESFDSREELFTPLARISPLSCGIVSFGQAEYARAARPATCGAAIEVPESDTYAPLRTVL